MKKLVISIVLSLIVIFSFLYFINSESTETKTLQGTLTLESKTRTIYLLDNTQLIGKEEQLKEVVGNEIKVQGEPIENDCTDETLQCLELPKLKVKNIELILNNTKTCNSNEDCAYLDNDGRECTNKENGLPELIIYDSAGCTCRNNQCIMHPCDDGSCVMLG
ncbi:MAG: hypothetical protein AABX11_03565 [Nanoarchaeota archaeon]